MTGDATRRVVLLVTSPRSPAGLLTARAWDLVREHPVYAAAEGEQVATLRAAGASVTIIEPVAGELLDAAERHGTVVWLAGPAGDERLAREIGLRLAREPGLAELELTFGSWDRAGARLLDAVAVIDRLASPGGDPWLLTYFDRAVPAPERHRSLAHYLLEEAYEAYDAMCAQDLTAVREELGDVLFQVVLHARLASDAGKLAGDDGEPDGGEPDGRFDIDDIAGDLVGKLVRRNPHVFGDAEVTSVEEITRNWERIKREEKERSSVMDGIALSQPALALAAKVLARAARSARPIDVDDLLGALAAGPGDARDSAAEARALGVRLLAMVAEARAEGLDPEGALRRVVIDAMAAIRRHEAMPG